jgi:hypothetical protein
MRKYPSGVSLVKARSGTGRLWPGQMIGLALSLAPAADERAGADDEAAAAAAAGCGEASKAKRKQVQQRRRQQWKERYGAQKEREGRVEWRMRCLAARLSRPPARCVRICVV